MTMPGRIAAVVPLIVLLTACGSILPPPPPSPQLYRLTALPAAGAAARPESIQLAVETPTAPAAFDTTRIALTRSPTTIDYFAGAAWTDRAGPALQNLIIESLGNAGRIRVVARPTPDLRADALLTTELRNFEADYRGAGPPVIRVSFLCRLVGWPSGVVIAVRRFSAAAPAKANDVPAIVDAFDRAFHATMRGLAPWTAAHLEDLAHRR